jgi:hypothetical protein
MKLLVLGATVFGIEMVREAGNASPRDPHLCGRPSAQTVRRYITIRQKSLNAAELEPVIKDMRPFCQDLDHGCRCQSGRQPSGQFGGALTAAMPKAGVKRVVVESVAFLFKDSIIPPAYLLGRLFPGMLLVMRPAWGIVSKGSCRGLLRAPPS